MNILISLSFLLLLSNLSDATYSKYGRTCEDIGCMSNEECVMEEDVCTLKSKGHCGTYPSCKRTSTKAASCDSYACPPTQICQMKNNKPRCVDSGSSKHKRQVQSYNSGGYNPSAPFPPNQGPHIYPTLPGYHGGNPGYNVNQSGSNYPGQQFPGQTYPGQTYPGQTYPGQTYPGQSYPGQTNPGQTYPGQQQHGQTYPGQSYPGQTVPGQTYPGQNRPGQTYPGQTYPGQTFPGQPIPGQSFPGQQYPNQHGQQYPGQTYPGQHQPGQQYPGQTYPNQQGGGSGDFYKDQTRNQGGNYNQPRRYKRAMQSYNYGSSTYNSSGVYNQQGLKGGYNPSPGGNTYPIPPGYTGHHGHSHHSGNVYPGQQSGSGRLPGQTYPNSQSGQTYPNSQSGQTYPNSQPGQTYPNHQTGQTYPSHQTGQTYPARPTYPNHQTNQNQQTGTNYPGSSGSYQGSGQNTYPSQTGSGHHSIPSGGSQSSHQTYPNQPTQQGGRDFYQDQLKNTQPRNQGSQYPNNNQNQGRRYRRSRSQGNNNNNINNSFAKPPTRNYPNFLSPDYPVSQQPYNPIYPQAPPHYPIYGSGGYGSNYPNQGFRPTLPHGFHHYTSRKPPVNNNNNYPYNSFSPIPMPSNSIWNSVSNFFKGIMTRF